MVEISNMTGNTVTHLAIYLPTLNGGGAERAMLNLAHGISERGCIVDLVLAQAQGPYLSEVRESIRIEDLKASRVLTSLPNLARYLRRVRPQVLLSALDYANVVALWARYLSGVPVRVIVNEQNTISRSAFNSARRRQRMVPHLARLFYPWADYIIGNSQGVAEDLSRVTRIPKEHIEILYNPVVTRDLREKAHAPLNHPWFESDQPPVILAVGRLTKQKDFPTLIQAVGQVRKTRQVRLIILGEGPDRNALEGLVNKLGLGDCVALPGFVENPYAYMNQASLFVLSSLWEGLPTVLIEALYCGRPIISTDCPSGPREILANGRYGRLIPLADVKALTQAIEAGLMDEIPPPNAESWQPYSMETVVDQYLGLMSNGSR